MDHGTDLGGPSYQARPSQILLASGGPAGFLLQLVCSFIHLTNTWDHQVFLTGNPDPPWALLSAQGRSFSLLTLLGPKLYPLCLWLSDT